MTVEISGERAAIKKVERKPKVDNRKIGKSLAVLEELVPLAFPMETQRTGHTENPEMISKYKKDDYTHACAILMHTGKSSFDIAMILLKKRPPVKAGMAFDVSDNEISSDVISLAEEIVKYWPRR